MHHLAVSYRAGESLITLRRIWKTTKLADKPSDGTVNTRAVDRKSGVCLGCHGLERKIRCGSRGGVETGFPLKDEKLSEKTAG